MARGSVALQAANAATFSLVGILWQQIAVAQDIRTCSGQEPCLQFTAEQRPGSCPGSSTGAACHFQVCFIVNTNLPGCILQGGQMNYICRGFPENALQCPADDPTDRVNNPSVLSSCQLAEPNTIVANTVRGDNSNADNICGELSSSTVDGNAAVRCSVNGQPSCSGVGQRPRECRWEVATPACEDVTTTESTSMSTTTEGSGTTASTTMFTTTEGSGTTASTTMSTTTEEAGTSPKPEKCKTKQYWCHMLCRYGLLLWSRKSRGKCMDQCDANFASSRGAMQAHCNAGGCAVVEGGGAETSLLQRTSKNVRMDAGGALQEQLPAQAPAVHAWRCDGSDFCKHMLASSWRTQAEDMELKAIRRACRRNFRTIARVVLKPFCYYGACPE